MLRDIGIFVLISLSISAIISCFMIIKERLDWCKRNKLKAILLFLFSLFVFFGSTLGLLKILTTTAAGTCYWVGDTNPANWNDATHWSSSSGGAGSTCDGGVVPDSDDTVVFNGANLNNVDVDVAVSIAALTNAGGYTGTLSWGANNLTVNGNLRWDGGTFTGGSGTLDINNGSLTQAGGTFTTPSGGTTIERDLTRTAGTFTNTGNTITFDATSSATDNSTVSVGGALGGIVVISKGIGVWCNFTVASGTSINLGANPTSTIHMYVSENITNNGTITIPSGTWTVNNTYGAGVNNGAIINNGTITHNGSAWVLNYTNIINNNGGTITHNGTVWDINKAATLTNNTGGAITYAGTNLTIEAGLTQSGTFDLSGKTITFDAAIWSTITANGALGGTVVFAKTAFGGGITIAAGTTINLGDNPTSTVGMYTSENFTNNGTIIIPLGTWTINNAYTGNCGPLINNGTITHSGNGWSIGNVNFTNNGTITYAGTITFSGSWNTTLSGSNSIPSSIDVNRSSSSVALTLGSSVNIGGNFTLTKGTVGGSSYTLTLEGNADFSGGTFTAGTGTVTFNKSSGTQTLKADSSSFYNISHSGAGTLQLVTNNLTVTTMLTNSAGTLDLNGKTLTATGATFSNDGTIKLQGAETITGLTQDTNSGTFEYTGRNASENLTIKDFGAGADYFHLAINDINATKATFILGADLNVDGNLSISSGTLSVSGSNYNINLAGNWSNSAIFTPNSGTVTLDGSSGEQVSCGGTGAGKTFNNLTSTNASASGVTFADPCTVTGIFTDITPSSKLTFHAGSTYVFANINLNGGAVGTRIVMVSSTPTSHWNFNVSGSPSASYVNVTDSDATAGSEINATTGCYDNGNNHHWLFVLGYSIAGTVYGTDESTSVASSPLVRAKINGAGDYSIAAAGDGTYTIPSITMNAGDPITVYLDTEGGISGAAFTVSTGANMTNIHIYQDRATTRCDNSCSLTNANIDKWDKSDDSDIHAGVATSNLTVDNDYKLLIAAHTFAPGGTVTNSTGGVNSYSGNLEIKASSTLNMAGNALSISGNYLNSGTATLSSNLTSFTKTIGAQTLNSGGTGVGYDFTNLTKSGGGTLQLITSNLAVSGNLIISGSTTVDLAGRGLTLATLDNSGTLQLQGGESMVITTMDTNTGTVLYVGAGAGPYNIKDFGVTDYYALTINPANGTDTFQLGADLQVNGTLTLSTGTLTTTGTNYALNIGDASISTGSYSQTNGTFTANGSAITCFGNYSIAGGAYNAGASTLTLDTTPQNIILTSGGHTLNNVNFKNNSDSGSGSVGLGAGILAFAGNFYLDAANTQTLTVTGVANNPTVNITGNLDFTGVGAGSESLLMGDGAWTVAGNVNFADGSITADGSTLIMSGASKVLTPSPQPLNNFTSSGTISSAGDFTVSAVFNISAGTFDGSNKTITLSGSGTPLVVTGAFTVSTSTIKYTGSNATNIVGTTYNNLYLDHDGTAFTAAGDLAVNSVLTVNAGTFSAADKIITLAGSGTPLVITGTFTPSTSTVKYTGGPAVTITAVTYHNLTVDNVLATFTAEDDLTVNSVITISAGDFDAADKAVTLAGSGTAMLIGGTFTPSTSTVKYTGASATTITNTNYHNLTLDHTDTTFSAGGSSTVGGVLNVNAGNFSGLNRTITLSGSGTPLVVVGTFTAGTSTIKYTGAAPTNVAGTTYHNLTLDQAGTAFTLGGDITVGSVLNINAGTFDASSRTINLAGSGTPLAGAGTFTPSTSTLIYNGSGATNISPANYFNLTLSGGGTYSLGAALVATGALTLSNGSLDTGAVTNYALTIGESTTTNGSYSQTNGAFTANNSTITSFGNYSIAGGTYNAGTSTLILDATPQNITLTSDGYTLNNTTLRSNANIVARTAVLGAGTLNFAGNFYLEAANSQNLTVTAAVNNPTVNISGNIDFIGIGVGSEAFNLGNSTFDVDGGTINFSGGAVTPGGSTLLFSGSALQTLTSASQTLYNLTITNPSAAGVALADGLTVTNNFSDTTANSNLTFDDGSIYTINNLELNGQVAGTRIDLRSSTPGTQWLLNVSGTQTISFVDAQDSDATGGNQINAVNGCFNSGNNLNWVFAVASIIVSPVSVTLNPGGTQAFTAAAYDGGGNLIPGTIFTWSVVNGGGSIDGSGNFIAGATLGTYANTVQATASAVNGLATVIVVSTPIPPTPTPSPTASAVVAPSGGAQEAAAFIPEKVVVGDEAVFDASKFEGYASYHWDFGDGNQADGIKVEHKYEKLDRYLVVLILIDKAGLETKKTFQVDVVPPEPKLIRIKTDKTNITVWGESYPGVEVILRLESEPFETKTISDTDGKYKLSFNFNETGLGYGEHKLSLVAAQKTEENLLLASDPNYYDVYFNLNDNGDLEVKVKQLEEQQLRRFYEIAGLVLILIIINIILIVIIIRRKNRAKIKNVSQNTKSQ